MKRLKILLVAFFALLSYQQYFYGSFHRAYIDYQLLSNDSVVVMYTADWCPACKEVRPILQKMNDVGLIKLIVADVDKEEYRHYNVLPYFIPQISIFRRETKASGLSYFGQFPQDEKAFMQVFTCSGTSEEDWLKFSLIAKAIYGTNI
jgi:thiol-disulfide isomerase/thioredoxin